MRVENITCITCPQCDREKMFSYTRCPHCGYINRRMDGSLRHSLLFLTVIIVVVFLADVVEDGKRGVVVEAQELQVNKQVVGDAFEGGGSGSLYLSTIGEWKRATYEEKSAVCKRLLRNVHPSFMKEPLEGKELERRGKIIRALVVCMDKTHYGDATADDLKTAETANYCMSLIDLL